MNLNFCDRLSGGDDSAHGDQTVMENAFNQGEANWEISRYAGVDHGFTVPSSRAYDLVADARSWESMLSFFRAAMPVPQMDSPESSPSGGSDNRPLAMLLVAIISSLYIVI